MTMVKRWGVMALVAALVLGTMGAALASEDTTETETTKPAFDVDSYIDTYEWASELMAIVHFWVGPGACPEPSSPAPSGFFYIPPTLPVEATDCTPSTLTGPNGQLNHGSMVSSVVHWLKGGNLEDLLASDEGLEGFDLEAFRDLPKGQLVKLFAHEDFGKGFDVRDSLVESDDVVETEDADGHGPPQWVKDKKADKAAKGKNK